ncbi:hypothetical protein FKP32DRAFT_1681084 [Trametes sanguinea]|nr:hypothetical protein FKP32DRAFT_1681084 [Trametes sanguinea]
MPPRRQTVHWNPPLPTLAELQIAFNTTICRKIPSLFAPILVPLPPRYPMAAVLNLYSGLMRIVPPTVIGPIESTGVSLFIHFPTCPPTPETPWILSDHSGKVHFELNTLVSLPILGVGEVVAIREVSIEGWSLLTIQTKRAKDMIYVLVPTESTRVLRVFSSDEAALGENRPPGPTRFRPDPLHQSNKYTAW